MFQKQVPYISGLQIFIPIVWAVFSFDGVLLEQDVCIQEAASVDCMGITLTWAEVHGSWSRQRLTVFPLDSSY